jgi:hypothetical protein
MTSWGVTGRGGSQLERPLRAIAHPSCPSCFPGGGPRGPLGRWGLLSVLFCDPLAPCVLLRSSHVSPKRPGASMATERCAWNGSPLSDGHLRCFQFGLLGKKLLQTLM